MLQQITQQVFNDIANPVFRDNAQIYLDIESSFKAQVESFGLGFDTAIHQAITDDLVKQLEEKGMTVANDCKSFHINWISPSCVACRKGYETATYLVSTQCQRDCFFCFNANQYDYEQRQVELADPSARLEELYTQGAVFNDLALTGGEPLLHKPQTEEFFRTVARLYPQAYTRLYTNGDLLDDAFLSTLASLGLDEIRFSIKTDDTEENHQKLFDLMGRVKKVLPAVVVEMPVMPDERKLMQSLLVTLDEIGINGINLLELCFPLHNAGEYQKRGYAIKTPPFRVLYNYDYAGGLPIAGSEEVCLDLLEFAVDNRLSLGVHYCSLENKFSGQIYLQNYWYRNSYNFCTFSERDYFLKSGKVFGEDVVPVSQLFVELELTHTRKDEDGGFIQFPLAYIEYLKDSFPQMELGISSHVVEGEKGNCVLRELCLTYTTPAAFDMAADAQTKVLLLRCKNQC